MKVFVDTNILIDLVCARKDFLEDARSLFMLAYMGRINIAMSALSFVNTVYVSRKYNFPQHDVNESLLRISTFTEIVSLSGNIIERALASGWADFEDATQFFCAQTAMADCIATRNKKDFTASSIPTFTAKEFTNAYNPPTP